MFITFKGPTEWSDFKENSSSQNNKLKVLSESDVDSVSPPELAQLCDAQLDPLGIASDTSTILHSFDSLSTRFKSEAPNTRFYSNNRIAGKSMPGPMEQSLLHERLHDMHAR